MMKLINLFGKALVVLGIIMSVVLWILTTVFFFSAGDNFLGFINLVVIPAEFVLPWVVSPSYGIMSLFGIIIVLLGTWLGGISAQD